MYDFGSPTGSDKLSGTACYEALTGTAQKPPPLPPDRAQSVYDEVGSIYDEVDDKNNYYLELVDDSESTKGAVANAYDELPESAV